MTEDEKTPADSSEADGEASFAVQCVRSLLERHGLPKYRQSAWLAEAMGLSYSQAHRRMNGTSTWSLEDIAKVAALFGESLADVVSPQAPRTSVPGTMRVGTATLPVSLWLGEPVERPSPESVVAVQTADGWTALVASESSEGVLYRIERLEATPELAPRRIVAVLDDNRDLTDSICTYLDASGYEALPYFAIAELEAGLGERRFDAFVVDWIVDDKSALQLVETIRADDPACPIVVLTGQVMTGAIDESEIADAVKRFGLVFHEKPVRTSILAATLARALTGAER